MEDSLSNSILVHLETMFPPAHLDRLQLVLGKAVTPKTWKAGVWAYCISTNSVT